MAKRKKKDDLGFQKGAEVEDKQLEDIRCKVGSTPPAVDPVTKPMPEIPTVDKAPVLPSTITILPNQHSIAEVGHHLTDGRPNRANIIKAMEMLITGFINFPGAYHDSRKRELYQHLADHYKSLGMEPPALR